MPTRNRRAAASMPPLRIPRLEPIGWYIVAWGLTVAFAALHYFALPALVQQAEVVKRVPGLARLNANLPPWPRPELILVGTLTTIGIIVLLLRRRSARLQNARNRRLGESGTVLLLALPEGDKSKIENMVEMLLGLRANLVQRTGQVWWGRGYHVALEVIRTSRGIGTYAWVPELPEEEQGPDLLRVTATQVRAAYQSAYVQPLDQDPIREAVERDGAAIIWADMKLTGPSYLPIRTSFGGDADPVRTLMQTLPVGGGISASGMQLLLRAPTSNAWQRRAGDEITRTKDRWTQIQTRMIPDAQKRRISEIERKKDALGGYQVVVRLWVAGTDPVSMTRRLGELQRLLSVYTDLNGFQTHRQGTGSGPVLGRYLPPFAPDCILHAEELAALFHLADDSFQLTDLLRASAKALPPQAGLVPGWEKPKEAFCVLGEHVYQDGRGKAPIGVTWLSLTKHASILGPTGTGKSTFVCNIALQAIRAGFSVIVLDPHSKLVYDIAARVPPERERDVYLVDFADPRRQVGINVLEMREGDSYDLLGAELMGIMEKVVGANWESSPRMQRLLRNMVLTLLEVFPGATMIEFFRMFADPGFREWIAAQAKDPIINLFWDAFENWSKSERSSALQPPLARIEAFLVNPSVRRVLAQSRSTVDLRQAMDEGKVLLFDVGVSKLRESNAELLGTLLMTKIRMEAMSRLREPWKEFRPVIFIIDEAHRFFVNKEAETILSEARKANLAMVFATQYSKQFGAIWDAVDGNVGTMIAFRLGDADAGLLARRYGVKPYDLSHLDKFHIYVWNESQLASGRTFDYPPTRAELEAASRRV